MLKRLSPREKIDQLLDEHWPLLKAAFAEGLEDIKSRVVLKRMVEALEHGNLLEAIDALQLEVEAFSQLERAIADAYNAGGVSVTEEVKLRDPQGHELVFRFGVRNLVGESWLRNHSAGLVTRIVEDQRAQIQVALSEGLARGDNPRTTALNIIGRVNRQSGKREGGIIGLSAPQERFVANARKELLSGDPATMAKYFDRERRDRRFDGAVRNAIAKGKPLPVDTVTRLIGRYSDRLLDLRGEMLARTETMQALSNGRNDAMRQAINAGKVDAELVTKVWRSARDGRVRHTHQVLNGKKAMMDETFRSPSGARLRYPGDPTAPTSEIMGCRCVVEYKVDYVRQHKGA